MMGTLHHNFFVGLGLLATMSCCKAAGTPPGTEDQPWSVRMANSVMTRCPSLTDMDRDFQTRKKLKWQYDIAMVAQAINGLEEIDPGYTRYMKEYMDVLVSPGGTIADYNRCDYNLDKINPGNNLIILYRRTGEERYLKAINQLMEQLNGQVHNPDGGFWHKARYPYQMWLDGVYMSSPFMARCGACFNDPKWFDRVHRQITVIEGHTRDERTGLLYHAYDASRGMKWSDDETGCSPHFWGRAMGWYMMALVDVLDFIPADHSGRDDIISILRRTSEALLGVRDKETGLWYQVLDMGGRPGNYLEASASCMFTYAMAKGARKGYLDPRYREIASDSFDAILEHFIQIEEDGLVSIDHGCFAAGLGGLDYRDGSYEYYVNERKGKNDSKSVGSFIMAALELGR
jgi:unsaturated rhamnogalacturonyl hydrolase